jgi:CRP-like cAMP-binding protein
MSRPSTETSANGLIARLSPADRGWLQDRLEEVELPLRFSLEKAHRPITHVYFPVSGIVSVVAKATGANSIEVCLIGREGMSGSAIVLGDRCSAQDTFVQAAGQGHRIPADTLFEAIASRPSLQPCFLHFVHTLLVQSAQTALANGRATIEQRLARWLLMARDRLEDEVLPLTHEFLGIMLGVRRAGVTEALQHLKSDALIGTQRGGILVRDRAGLEALAGDFYGVPEAEYQRLLAKSVVRKN